MSGRAGRTSAAEAARRARRAAEIEARSWMSPTGSAPERFRVVSWNVNSLRTRAEAVGRFLDRARPDLVCLQETKLAIVPAPVASVFADRGYRLEVVGDGGYNGVAIATTHPVVSVSRSGELGAEALDREARMISCVVGRSAPVRVVSVYVPHGREPGHWHYEYKLGFLHQLAERVSTWIDDGPLILAGDLNVAATDSDVFHPDAFRGSTHVTEPERTALSAILDAGLVDVDVARWGERARRFTWWNYGIGYTRNLGMRLDVIAVTHDLADRLDTTWIDHVERQEQRPSDHAALLADLRLLENPPPRTP